MLLLWDDIIQPSLHQLAQKYNWDKWSATSIILTYIPALSTATNAAKSTTCTPRRSNKALSPTSPWLSKWPPAQGPWPWSLDKASLSWKKKKKEINQLRDLMSTWASILMRSQVMFVKIKYRRFYMKKENTKDEVLLIWLEGFFLFIFKHSLRKKQ